jgi:hypothetical protein
MKLPLSHLAAAACLSVVMLAVSVAQQNAEPPPSPSASAQSAAIEATPHKSGPAVSSKNAVAAPNEPRGIVVDPSGIRIGDERGINIGLGPTNGRVGWFAQFIGLIAVLSPFVTLIAIFAIVLHFRHRRRVILHETLRAMVEKGQPIPPELLAGGADVSNGGRRRSPHGDLRGGLVLVSLGAALFYLQGKWGLIPFAIGLALLIVSALERWEKSKQGTNS